MMPVNETEWTRSAQEQEGLGAWEPEAARMVAALQVLIAPMQRTIVSMRWVIAALSVVLVGLSAVLAWNGASEEVYFASLGPGVQRVRPGEISESYLHELTIHLTRLMGNVDGESVAAAIKEMGAHMAPELRVEFRALHHAAQQQLEQGDQWIYTPKIAVRKVTRTPAQIGRRFAYTVELQARQVFGFLDRHSGYRDTPIVYVIEPRLINHEQAGAVITALMWPNMLRSEGAVAYSPEPFGRNP